MPDAAGCMAIGQAKYERGELEQAVAAYRKATQLRPDWPDAWNNLGIGLLELGLARSAWEALRHGLTLPRATPQLFSNFLLASNYVPDLSPEQSRQLHARYGQLTQSRAEPLPARSRDRQRTHLRLGLVSGDFRHHTVGLLIESLLPALRSEGFETFAYSTRPGLPGDPVPGRLRTCVDHWRDIETLPDHAVAARIVEDAVDILIDLSGHTGFERLGVFALRPAPLQASWLGYGATTGLTRIDAALGDPWSTPPGDEGHFVERLVRLPLPRLPYTPPADAPEVSPSPLASTGMTTFSCFNNATKLSPRVITLWAEILAAVPGSTLLLKGRQYDWPSTRTGLIKAFSVAGMDPERVRFDPWEPRANYYSAFSRTDIALDPFPFTGGISTLDALWMGVPVVSLRGDRMIARQGAMILEPLGLGDWVAGNEADYVARAVRAAFEPQVLQSLRTTLRERVRAADFANPHRYAKALADTLRQLWTEVPEPKG